jgi:hypothetical protein
MQPTQQEYDEIAKKIETHMEYYIDIYSKMDEDKKQQYIQEKVEKHFREFLNNSEKEKITELIIQNFKENHGYIDEVDETDEPVLPTGNLTCKEIPVVVSHFNKFFDKEHMEKWYSQYYYNQLASIIKSKKL